MQHITKITPLADSRLRVLFADGTEGEVELKDRLIGPVLEPLRDPELFARVSLDEFGAPYWPNGADWAPDALYEELCAHGLRRGRR